MCAETRPWRSSEGQRRDESARGFKQVVIQEMTCAALEEFRHTASSMHTKRHSAAIRRKERFASRRCQPRALSCFGWHRQSSSCCPTTSPTPCPWWLTPVSHVTTFSEPHGAQQTDGCTSPTSARATAQRKLTIFLVSILYDELRKYRYSLILLCSTFFAPIWALLVELRLGTLLTVSIAVPGFV